MKIAMLNKTNDRTRPNAEQVWGVAYRTFRGIGKRDLIFLALLGVILLGVYGRTLNYDLIWDDRLYFKGNVLLDENRPLWDAFEYGYFGDQLGVRGFDQYYRPLLTATFMLEKRLWGIRNTTLRLTNLSIFFLSLCFLFVFFKQHSERAYFPEMVTLLFALHPLHLDNIVWIVGRGDLLLLFWAALTFLNLELYIQKKKVGFLLLSTLFFVLGLLSKESMLFFLPLLVVYELLRRKKITIPYHLASVAAILLFYYVKLHLLDIGNVRFMPSTNLVESLKRIVATLGYYVKSMVFPLSSEMFISRNDVVTLSYLALGIAAILAFFFLFYLSKKHRGILFPAFLAGSFLGGHGALIFTPIFPYQIYSRYAMMAVLGFCWIGTILICTLKEKQRFYPVLILTLVFIPTIVLNSSAYKTEISFWKKAATFASHDAFVQFEIAQASFENRDYLTSEIHLNRCLSLNMKRRTAALVSLLYADLEFERANYTNVRRWLGNLEGFTQVPNFSMTPKLRMDINKKLALVDMACGAVGSAEGLLLRNIDRYPNYSANYTELYRLFIGYNLWEKAEDLERKIRARFPAFFSGKPNTQMIKEKFESLNLEQKIYFATQYSNYSQSIELVQKKPKLEMEDRFFLAKLYYFKGDENRGKDIVAQIYENHSADYNVLNRIGGFYLRELIRADEALTYFEKSLELESDQTAIRNVIHSIKENYLSKLNPVWN